MTLRVLSFAVLATLSLNACSILDSEGTEKPLEGERISILELQKNLEPDDAAMEAQGFVAPPAWRNEFWPQAGGYPTHAMQNLTLNEGELKPQWSADIGDGGSDGLPLTAQPVVADGKLFTLDSRGRLSAFDAASGRPLWQVYAGSEKEKEPVIAGGVAYSRGQLYVTNGYNEVLAVSPANGKPLWRKNISAPARAAPTVAEDRLFVVTLDNRLIALSVKDGTFLWDYAGISGVTGLMGSASPAASNEIVVPVFSSGEIFALRVENGAPLWGDNLSSVKTTSGLSGIADIRGLPVIDKGMVFAISFSNRLVAIDERTGNRVWQREIGGAETPWLSGNYLFLITNDNELIGMGRDNGLIRWVRPLPKFRDPEDRKGPLFWTGPVLAGNRLIVAGSDGGVMEINPDDGAVLRAWNSGKSVTTAPVVAGEMLYLLADDGTVLAYK